MSYASFTVSHCWIGLYVVIINADTNQQFGDYFAKQMNSQEYFVYTHYIPKEFNDVKISNFGETNW